ncbi:hypothetical protein EI94DRAFT_1716797 [Lactarius quietus]|nr:hypothetical protein EI94DRAFT_1716797 [Lactarius quietus]
MAVPDKYKHMGDFHKDHVRHDLNLPRYYKGQAKAPVLTIVIGGNHEASNHMWELYYGGWLAPNIYFLGHAGCVQANGIRIAGASGIFKPNDYHHGHFEKQPYDNSTKRSIYHIREYNVRRLSLLSSPDVFLSHDWPSGVEQHGNLKDLLRRKPFFRGDIQSKRLGSPPLMSLLRNLKPSWCSRAARSPWTPVVAVSNPDEIVIGDEDDDFDVPSSTAAPQNPDEIGLENEGEAVALPPPAPRETKFLALDNVVDIPTKEEGTSSEEPATVVLSYDPEWLAITRAFQPYLSRKREQAVYPDPDSARAAVAREWDWVHAHALPKLGAECRVDACQRFVEGVDGAHQQTDAFVALLEMENVVR